MDSPIGQAHACAMPVAVNSALLYVCCLHLCSNIHVKHLRGFRLGWIISSALCGCESCTADLYAYSKLSLTSTLSVKILHHMEGM